MQTSLCLRDMVKTIDQIKQFKKDVLPFSLIFMVNCILAFCLLKCSFLFLFLFYLPYIIGYSLRSRRRKG